MGVAGDDVEVASVVGGLRRDELSWELRGQVGRGTAEGDAGVPGGEGAAEGGEADAACGAEEEDCFGHDGVDGGGDSVGPLGWSWHGLVIFREGTERDCVQMDLGS